MNKCTPMRYQRANVSSICSRFPLADCASETSAVSCAAVESAGSASTRTTSTPVWRKKERNKPA